jgi:hypothetical protein
LENLGIDTVIDTAIDAVIDTVIDYCFEQAIVCLTCPD